MDTSNEGLDHRCFFDGNFNVDYYLSTHMHKCDLLTLRKELKKYGAQLYNETINILKTETKSIVHFAESLCLLQSKVSKLSQPVLQFREEIRTIHDFITKIQDNYQTISRNLQNSDREQHLINLKIGIISSITYIKCIIMHSDLSKEDLMTLKWLVNEYSFQLNYLKELGFSHSDFGAYINEVENKLKECINKEFLKAFQEKDDNTILCCLRLYHSLSEQAEAERNIREKVIKPKLKVIFSQENLDKNSQDLNMLYSESLHILQNEINILHNLINQNSELTGFNFIINSFWKEVDIELIEGLSNITAPGNPYLFQKRFHDSWNFLQEIMRHDPNAEQNKYQYYQAHIKRFNLPVYFEIRYQQIGAKLEQSIIEDSTITENPQSIQKRIFYLKPTDVLWECLCSCFSKEIFLEHLTDQFVRLSMLLLSRYLKWLEDVFASEENDKYKLDIFFIYSLADLSTLQTKVGLKFSDPIDSSIYRILPEKVKVILVKIFKTNGTKIESTENVIKDKLILRNVQSTHNHLQQVRSIPRIYRKTNRSAPKVPSPYVVDLINDLKRFHEAYRNTGVSENILISIIERTSEKYLDLIKEVLHSVSETEKSLRRLKNRSLTNTDEIFTNQGGSEAVSDEKKIKSQIKLDADYYLKEVIQFPIQQDCLAISNLSRIDFLT